MSEDTITVDSSGAELTKAREAVARLLPAIPAIFSSPIRAIRSEILTKGQLASDEKIWNACSFLMGVSPTTKAVFLKAAESLKPDGLAKLSPLTPRSLLTLFDPAEITAVLGLVYLHRALRKSVDAASWERIEEQTFINLLISHCVAATVKYVGSGDGMLQAGLRGFAQAVLLLTPAGNSQRRPLPKDMLRLSPENREISKYGFSHLHVSAALASALGFGTDISMGLLVSAESNEVPEGIRLRASAWKAVRIIADSFQALGASPKVPEDSELYLSEEENKELSAQITALLERSLGKPWLAATPDDLTDGQRQALDIVPRATNTGSPHDEPLNS